MTDSNDGPKFALRNGIYHSARRDFYGSSNRWLNFDVIILGAGVAGKASKLFHVEELWLEFGVLVFATLQLTFDFGYKARTHEFLQRKYNEMLADLEFFRSSPGNGHRRVVCHVSKVPTGDIQTRWEPVTGVNAWGCWSGDGQRAHKLPFRLILKSSSKKVAGYRI
ncbi:hypothetical protein [Bradyrhizobium valentinum]|uniref:Uncharacterized protein n=1 Tax=Bradyrhizobium valentinum TaxID=1518501 RepID=A0A0R3M230_9BRAD|nr:hypothetical protein [Bradyrhizobium valentinum]KRR10517.1 hypothetical protein CQ10_40800 [Bradyrhizobium valentinum]KRR11629.1 hypothetical protein CP49_40840 [Bradyrhizobium valentinum]